jgi:hypothetical protein
MAMQFEWDEEKAERVFNNSPRRTRRDTKVGENKENLCKSVQSVAKSCPSEPINWVSTEFQNTL